MAAPPNSDVRDLIAALALPAMPIRVSFFAFPGVADEAGWRDCADLLVSRARSWARDTGVVLVQMVVETGRPAPSGQLYAECDVLGIQCVTGEDASHLKRVLAGMRRSLRQVVVRRWEERDGHTGTLSDQEKARGRPVRVDAPTPDHGRR